MNPRCPNGHGEMNRSPWSGDWVCDVCAYVIDGGTSGSALHRMPRDVGAARWAPLLAARSGIVPERASLP